MFCANVGGYSPKVNDVLGIINGEVVSLENIAEMNDTDAIKKVPLPYPMFCIALIIVLRCTRYPKKSVPLHLWRTQ